MKIQKYIKVLRRGEKVIFINRMSGLWIKLPSDIADILKFVDDNNLKYEELKEMLYDDEDRKIFDQLMVELDKMDFFEMKHFKYNQIDNISYAVINNCNLNCKHCMVSANNGKIKEFFNTTEIKKNLDKIIKLNPRNIIITGGEPMLRNDFFEISEYCRANFNGILTLMTNGTLINKDNSHRLSKLYDTFDISIDGYYDKWFYWDLFGRLHY